VPYLDNAATTRPLPEVVARVAEVLKDDFGNASAPHALGRQAKDILEESRAIVAESLGAEPEELYFLSGGTEANNLAIRGAFFASLAETRERRTLVTTTLEHPSVTKTIRDLRRQGFPVEYVEARGGELNLEGLATALNAPTPVALISVMQVQNVFGYRFPVDAVARARDELAPHAILHSDAAQAFGKMPLAPAKSGIDLLTLSAHKIGGPKGVGALYVRKGLRMFTTAFGGGQERGLRSGTEAVPLVAGFAQAVRLTFERRERVEHHVTALKTALETGLRAAFPDVLINSRPDGSPFIVHFSLPGLRNEQALWRLSEQGFYLGISAACDSSHYLPDVPVRPKHPTVARLAGLTAHQERSSFRVSFAADNSLADIEGLIAHLLALR
jgi:cysteine desulfurase